LNVIKSYLIGNRMIIHTEENQLSL
jgi:hypothetical protein